MLQYITVKKYLQKNKGKSSEGDARPARPAIAAHSTAEGPDETERHTRCARGLWRQVTRVAEKKIRFFTLFPCLSTRCGRYVCGIALKGNLEPSWKDLTRHLSCKSAFISYSRIPFSCVFSSIENIRSDGKSWLLFHSCNPLRFLGANTSPSPASSRSRKLWQVWTSCLRHSNILILWRILKNQVLLGCSLTKYLKRNKIKRIGNQFNKKWSFQRLSTAPPVVPGAPASSTYSEHFWLSSIWAATPSCRYATVPSHEERLSFLLWLFSGFMQNFPASTSPASRTWMLDDIGQGQQNSIFSLTALLVKACQSCLQLSDNMFIFSLWGCLLLTHGVDGKKQRAHKCGKCFFILSAFAANTDTDIMCPAMQSIAHRLETSGVAHLPSVPVR